MKKNSLYAKDIREAVKACEALRKDTKTPTDISFAEYVQARWNLSLEAFYDDIGINPNQDCIQNLVNMPDENFKWLIPEIYREAIRLGLRKNPIYPNLIAGEQTVSQTSVKMPAINMSDATPMLVGVAETIPIGDVSFQEKSVKIYKMGRGIKVPYEVINYVALNIVSIFLQDYGVKLAGGLDYLAITTLLNGDQPDGSDSAAVVGIATPPTLAYRDLLTYWVRMARLGRNVNDVVAGEAMAIDYLELLTNTRLLGTARTTVTLKTPIPSNSNLFVHSAVPDPRLLMVDNTSAMIKLNAQPLLVESDRIIANQTTETYATLTTGYATLFRDARLVVDKTLPFATNGFPSWMNPTASEQIIIK